MPESPSWLLSKDRAVDAEKSLRWLRGWVSPQTVRTEFDELQNYCDLSNACASCAKQSIECHHAKPTFWHNIKEIKRYGRPLIFTFWLGLFCNFSGSYPLELYTVQTLIAFESPINANQALVLISGFGIGGGIFLLATVKKLGRRKLYLPSVFLIALLCIALGLYELIRFFRL